MPGDKEIVYKAFTKSSKRLKAGEVTYISGIEKAEVSKITKTLQKEGKLVSPKNCHYAPS